MHKKGAALAVLLPELYCSAVCLDPSCASLASDSLRISSSANGKCLFLVFVWSATRFGVLPWPRLLADPHFGRVDDLTAPRMKKDICNLVVSQYNGQYLCDFAVLLGTIRSLATCAPRQLKDFRFGHTLSQSPGAPLYECQHFGYGLGLYF